MGQAILPWRSSLRAVVSFMPNIPMVYDGRYWPISRFKHVKKPSSKVGLNMQGKKQNAK